MEAISSPMLPHLPRDVKGTGGEKSAGRGKKSWQTLENACICGKSVVYFALYESTAVREGGISRRETGDCKERRVRR